LTYNTKITTPKRYFNIELNNKNKKLLSNLPLAGKKLDNDKEKREWLCKRFELVDAMNLTGQLEHGWNVYKNFLLILRYLEGHTEEANLFIPNWLKENKEAFKQLLNQNDTFYQIEKYLIWHDCGKPFCLKMDNEGKKHYPDHENISYQIAKCCLQELDKKNS
jgi:hypothetical protein